LPGCYVNIDIWNRDIGFQNGMWKVLKVRFCIIGVTFLFMCLRYS
jgi:hypothetical protein